jgi:hypothetical protein
MVRLYISPSTCSCIAMNSNDAMYVRNGCNEQYSIRQHMLSSRTSWVCIGIIQPTWICEGTNYESSGDSANQRVISSLNAPKISKYRTRLNNIKYIEIHLNTIITLWLFNIAMEAMAHRNRWFTY